MNSQVHFNRWSHVQWQTRPFQVFKQYNEELSQFVWAEYAAHEYVKNYIIDIVPPDDDCTSHFTFPSGVHNFVKMHEWSNAFNSGQNYLYLNCVVSMSCNLETFLKAIISLAIVSNPGVLTNHPNSLDGVINLKNNTPLTGYRNWVKKCVDGTWPHRLKAMRGIFGGYPHEFDLYLNDLEAIRVMRNKVGHAFGREIDRASDYYSTEKLPSETVSIMTLKYWLKVVYDVAAAMDHYLLDNFIGEYHAILEYHKHKHEWRYNFYDKQARELKTLYGQMDQQVGLAFCEELIDYYNKL